MSVKFSWGNSIKAFQNFTDDFGDDVQEQVNEIVRKTAKEVIAEVKRRTPVRSGRLRNGWKKESSNKNNKLTIEILNRVPNAIYVEKGTRYQVPTNMLSITIARARQRLKRRLKNLSRKMARKFNK